ncbi:potassium transporter Kup [Solilutibacter silvestris]|uniref:Probable potassium transport system protein Kup n=1 Tax=Solilutibacter silvestris TaxID=1645665 RepID=A0A2K1PYF4_9GAMM|nr:KUP/HAK/KT family potassium transporter [Lysobacter silvestris]PNS07824.1 K+ transporter [Lysobacter silvestris]
MNRPIVTTAGSGAAAPLQPEGRYRMQKKSLAALSLAALGVVYGDIGTSPLYAFKVAVQAGSGAGLGLAATAMGIASLVIWSLVVIVSIKYAILIMRADNHGEGGVVAMLALLGARDAQPGSRRAALLVLGLFGAALLYGDGAITPAISVLSALEGLKADAPILGGIVIPATIVILVALFLVQSKGTGFIGRIFGPVMMCWFLAIGVLGIKGIAEHPQVLAALLPTTAIEFLAHAPIHVSFGVMGAVFLAVTGGEAMYADMGHFGRSAIRAAWFVIALPALVLNYLGQAGLVAAHADAAGNPFFGLAPGWAHYPLVFFATAATVIASQAIISGVFSLTQQVVQLGFLPRIRILHTDRDESGQIYVPTANWLLALATITAVLVFRSSDALAGAYGIAVSALMAISTFLATLVAIKWGYNRGMVLLVNGAFLLIDLFFFAANSLKLFDGGWFPLLITVAVAFLMLTWHRGLQLIEAARADRRVDEADFMAMLAQSGISRFPGTAAFLSASRTGIPLSLSTHLKHDKALQEHVLLVSVVTEEVPFVEPSQRAEVSDLCPSFQRVILKFGFMESLDIPAGLAAAATCIPPEQLSQVSYYIGHETVIADPAIKGMAQWRESMFVWMQRNSAPTGSSFGIATDQLVELGTEIRI